ncbi:MAG TPA: isopentenyl phosphate kinase [Methanocorpusculum sp.]|nr:isopentenyl phosphate kinase [Methanocorpusculum sp.]
MTDDVIILKLGGSIVTKKSEQDVIDIESIRNISSQISKISNSKSLVIVHGAGSCGHPEAKQYQIQSGVTRSNVSGISITHSAVKKLNEVIVSCLREFGVNAVSIHPFCSSLAKSGRLVYYGEDQVKLLLNLGVVPVLHGDVVMDIDRGACIVSGDQILCSLAKSMKASKVGLATDVPGVLMNGSVVPIITRKNVNSVALGESSNIDVTGGMSGKIDELLGLADIGISSHIFHTSQIMNFLCNREHSGTIIQ